ncbi:MAG: sulfurtransferase-like selenium metabolism protein YedF [Eubacteriales bacterium]
MNGSMDIKSKPCLDDKMVIVITSDQFGQGEKELSENLMKSFIYSLTEVNPRPDTLIFLNRGVFLTTEDSTVVESLRTLEAEGVEILSCGTCLNYYKLTEKLIIGTVSNMYNIVAKLNNTSNKIKI